MFVKMIINTMFGHVSIIINSNGNRNKYLHTTSLREALFTFESAKLGDVRSFVRSVRKIIDFCREDLRGRHVLPSLGSLNYEFGGFQKKMKY